MLLYFILPYQKTTLLLIPYNFTIHSVSQNSIFIKILFFNFSLLFLFNGHFFFSNFGMFQFSWAFQQYFFSLSPSTSSTDSTHKATHTNPWYTDQPIQTHHHTHTQTQTIKPLTKPHTQTQTINRVTHTQTIKPVGANNGHHTHHPSHQSANPSLWSETPPPIWNPADLKSIGANPFKKNHHRSYHWSYRWSTQLINRSTVSNPPSTNPNPQPTSATTQPRPKHWTQPRPTTPLSTGHSKKKKNHNHNHHNDPCRHSHQKKKSATTKLVGS